MENNLFNYLLIPEIFFTILILVLILLGLFKKNDSFKFINLLSCTTLFFVFILVFLDINISSSNYNYFFINNYIINFFKLLIIFGCFSSLIITKKYFIDVKLVSFEIPILILFACLGMMVMISSNNISNIKDIQILRLGPIPASRNLQEFLKNSFEIICCIKGFTLFILPPRNCFFILNFNLT